MITYQDFKKEPNKLYFIKSAIQKHMSSDLYKTAISADKYDRQKNETIYNYVQTIFTLSGLKIEDFTATNNKIASNFFHRLNTQRCMYSLGNGVSFSMRKVKRKNEDGIEATIDLTNEELGTRFDTSIQELGYAALIHGVSFGFWNLDRLHVFRVTEFVPIWDEYDGTLRAGIRFWQIDPEKPFVAVLYEEDGYTKYRSKGDRGSLDFEQYEEKRPYKVIYQSSVADGEEIVGEENYGALPIIPMWGNGLKQSTLIGMRNAIDSFDLIRSGFANDLSDCAQIFWILENAGGMSTAELSHFRDKLRINHIASLDTDEGSITPYAQDLPYSARKEYLDMIRNGIYEDFGALDVHAVAAGATNDHIDAAYQPMDEEAADFEKYVTKFIQQLLSLIGIEDVPVFKRNRISNRKEQTDMILQSADYLDDETILQKLPFIEVDEVSTILAKRDLESQSRFEQEENSADSNLDNNEETEEIEA